MDLPAPPDEASSIELLRRARGGEASAFDLLFRRHRDELLLAVRAGMGPRLRAAMQSEDVLQSVAMEAFAALQRREPQADGFTRLLRRIVRHRLIDRARALRRRPGVAPLTPSVEDALATPSPPTYDDPRYERIERALRVMPAELREVIRLRRFDGLSSQEVATRLHRSDAAVRQLFSRAMARLTMELRRDP
ncbi:MAG: sigma-70 family RNA polymerase sigma factor [Planctomycetes bacterium]|nr:sigma-70 family RNA polymerase sigma factor [Planctomycetota bacterium]